MRLVTSVLTDDGPLAPPTHCIPSYLSGALLAPTFWDGPLARQGPGGTAASAQLLLSAGPPSTGYAGRTS